MIRTTRTLLKPAEAALALGISVGTLGAWVREGRVPAGIVTVLPSGHKRYDAEAFEAWVNGSRTRHPAGRALPQAGDPETELSDAEREAGSRYTIGMPLGHPEGLGETVIGPQLAALQAVLWPEFEYTDIFKDIWGEIS